jgi:hypothetical protein
VSSHLSSVAQRYSSAVTLPFTTTERLFQTHEINVVTARAKAISNLAQPKDIAEFLSRSSECLSELRSIVAEHRDKVSEGAKEALDDLDKANEHIKRAAGSGGNGNGESPDPSKPPKPPNDPWWRKFFETLKAFAKRLGELSASIARELHAVSKVAIASAWSAFWTGAAPTIIGFIIWSLGGPPPGSFG